MANTRAKPATPPSRGIPPYVVGKRRAHRVQELRRRARARIHERVVRPISAPSEVRDPLDRRQVDRPGVFGLVVLLLLAALLHVIVIAGFVGGGELTRGQRPVKSERVQVAVVEPPEPATPEPAPVEPEPADSVAQKVRPPKQNVDPKPQKASEPKEILADPLNQPPPETPVNTPRRRVVGLSYESTVQGGSGPAFAVGNTRMGETAKVAEKAEPSAKTKIVNKAATRLPRAGSLATKPRRMKSVPPTYPPLLREQGIEADVVVIVSINTEGKVGSVKVVVPAQYDEFNKAAVAAAKKEVYAPATRDGKPVAYTQRYTVRFRLND